jgi:predicted DCC family thiol-disulfide oxidoreductase YuxK
MTANNATLRFPLTLLYDAACPVCSLEMDHLRERCTSGSLRFVDITAPGFSAAAWGTTQAELMARIHGVRPDGTHLIGLAALREAYAAAGLGHWLAPTGWRGVAGVADTAYEQFARHRQRVSRWAAPLIGAIRTWRARRTLRRMAACQGGACRIDNDTRSAR